MTYTFARQDWKKDSNFDLEKMCNVGKELGVEGVDIVSHSPRRSAVYTPDAANQKAIEYINNILKTN